MCAQRKRPTEYRGVIALEFVKIDGLEKKKRKIKKQTGINRYENKVENSNVGWRAVRSKRTTVYQKNP